jgi:hypothetical protein
MTEALVYVQFLIKLRAPSILLGHSEDPGLRISVESGAKFSDSRTIECQKSESHPGSVNMYSQSKETDSSATIARVRSRITKRISRII